MDVNEALLEIEENLVERLSKLNDFQTSTEMRLKDIEKELLVTSKWISEIE